MSGWGRISVLLGAGVVFGLGCGGRTGALEDEYGYGADGAGAAAGSAQGGKSSVAGKPGRAGTSSVGGVASYAGTVGYGGAASYGGAVYYGGAPSYGGYYPGGAYPVAGTFSVGGYYGGGFPVGGYGGFPVGGYGGAPPQDCAQCLFNRCNEPFSACLQDFGCLSILSCMESKGCQAFECYTDQYCRGTIDEWGGPAGQSMNELLQTFSCAVQAGCQCD